MAPLLLVDTPYLLFRAAFSLPSSITDPDGQPVNALLGTANALLQVVEEREPRAVILCFGEEAADYRVELYPAYHAHREPMPDPLGRQFDEAPGFFEAFGWPSMSAPGLEADDVLGSLASIEAAAGGEALIFTGDRDMFQCVGERVTVLYAAQSKGGPAVVDAAEVRKRYGIGPELVPDFIALRGDPSDGLPGGKGIGEKTAAGLLARHGSLEGAIAGALSEPPRVRGSLRGQADELRAFKDIATLRHVEVERPPDRPLDRAGAAAAARARGMNRLAERLAGGGSSSVA